MDTTQREDMNIVIVGHVDHGKSTLIGRMLADTHSLPEGKLEQIQEMCRRNARPFEYAFLLDALKDERAQGITIDTARCFFKTQKRDYIILDAPGHIEFLKNMITGAARAQAAILVIDAKEGVQENSRRHGYMLSLLGIKSVAVVINKMDLVDYSEAEFQRVKEEYLQFLQQIHIEPMAVIPISAMQGDNVAEDSPRMPWYTGGSVLETLDRFAGQQSSDSLAFRMPVQDIYKFTANGDDRRIIAGTIDSGRIAADSRVVFYPSGKTSLVKTIESFPDKQSTQAVSGQAIGVTLAEQIYIKRGELMCVEGETVPHVTARFRANIFWLGKEPLLPTKRYSLKIGCAKVGVVVEQICSVMNSADLQTEARDWVGCNEVAECIFHTENPIAFDTVEQSVETSRFVLVDQYEIRGGGIILHALEDAQSHIRGQVLRRNYKWEPSSIPAEVRAEQYSQKPILMLITGDVGVGKKELAKRLEQELVSRGRIAYFMGIGSFLYGVDADIKAVPRDQHEETIRRFGEVVNLMLDAGLILLVTARNITDADMCILKEIISDAIEVVWVGERTENAVAADTCLKRWNTEENIRTLKSRLQERGCIFRA